jgi:DNA adenine methylase
MRRGNAMYAHELTDDDHAQLAVVLAEIEGMAIIPGYDCGLYQWLFGDWTQVRKDHVIDGGHKREEILWLNPAAVANMPAPSLAMELEN